MDKQEAIKKAWGDQYPPDGVDDNGWSKKEFKYGEYNVSDFDAKMYLCGANIRPKELQGIENNNGWIKIENEKDFPQKDDCDYWIVKNGNIELFHWLKEETLNSVARLSVITHYQRIAKPRPPIY